MQKMLSKILNVFNDGGRFTVIFKDGTREECKTMYKMDIHLEKDHFLDTQELFGTFNCFVKNQPVKFDIYGIERIIKRKN